MKHFSAVLLCISIFGIWSCKHDMRDVDPFQNGETVPVEFAVNPIEVAAATTKADINLPEGTTVRVLVYKRAEGGSAADPAVDTYVAENTYKILADGSFAPCKVNAAGKLVAGDGAILELHRRAYDFYAYAPAVEMPVAARPALQIAQGTDHLGIAAVTATIAGKRANVDLGAFKHKGSQLHFTVTRQADANTVYDVDLQAAGVKVEKLSASPASYTLGGDIAAAGAAYSGTSDIPGGWFVRTNDYTVAALDTILPRAANAVPGDDLKLTFNVLVNKTFNKTYTATVSTSSFVPGNRYLFNVLVKDGGATLTMFELLPWTTNVMSDEEVGGDPSNGIVLGEWSQENWETGMGDGGVVPVPIPVLEPANSFMVLPGETISFDARVQGNGGVGAVAIAPTSLVVLWQDAQGLISSVDLQSGLAMVKTTYGVKGNALIAAYSGANGTGTILWSWHIWVTDYTPNGAGYATRTANTAYTVTGGQVHTYGIAFQTANGTNKTIMDRNLGATKAIYSNNPTIAEGTASFGLFYQWGRKDPFPGWDGVNATTPATQKLYAANGTTAADGNYKNVAGPVSVATAIANPGNFYYAAATPYDWTTPQNDALWGNGAKKSIYDPCPKGWRVAPDGTWADFGTNAYATPFYYYINGVKQAANGTPVFVASGRNGRYYEPTAGTVRAWYPASGCRDAGDNIKGGDLIFTGNYGSSWSSAVSDINGLRLHFSSTGIRPSGTNGRANGYEVRCVQE